MQKFKKKPVEIEAVQFNTVNWKSIEGWSGGKVRAVGNWNHENDVACLNIPTFEGPMTALPGDWIIRGIKGEFYPCKPDIFEATYDKVA